MPLVNLTAVTKVDIGDDWYELRNELGFYEETIMLVDAFDPKEFKSFQLLGEENGTIKSKRTPGEMIARKNFTRIQAYLVAWSHVENPEEADESKRIPIPLTAENIRLIAREDAKILLDKLEEIEDSIPLPFRETEETTEQTE